MRRRDFLKAAMATPLVAACNSAAPPRRSIDGPMPALFVAHGSPLLLDDQVWVSQLKAWSDAIPTPRAILVISAHWEANPITVGATEPTPLLFDFAGFPDRYMRVTYPAPGAPRLADEV